MKKISLWGAQSLKKMLNIVLSVEANRWLKAYLLT